MMLRAGILSIALIGMSIAATAAPPTDAASARRAEDGYVLGAGDLVEVAVLGQPEFTTRAKVRSDGTIAVPFLGGVPVSGDTVIACAGDLTARLIKGGYYQRPVVSVEIAAYASRTVIVLGEVGVPGIVPIDRPYHLSKIIARSGGLRETGADYVMLRHSDGSEVRVSYAQLGSGDAHADPIVEPGDKIFVPIAPTFSVYGQVNASGTFPIKGVMTLQNVIARAGGLRENGSEGRSKLVRDGKRIRMTRTTEIMPGDVIIIGERLF
jgi:polysaccharide export outer membrane protein